MLARQYCFSYTSIPFWSGYCFGDRTLFFAQASLDCDPPVTGMSPCPVFFFFLSRWGLANLDWPGTVCPPNNSCAPLYPTVGSDGVSLTFCLG
jgi:hypothetical protein